ncbi:MAG: PIN domain-containing protein [Chitinophagales bacterium]
MSKLLIDNNIVIDLLDKREPFFNSAAYVFSMADKGMFELSVSALTIANTNFILSRSKPAKEAREIIRKFRAIVQILPIDAKIIDLAINDSGFSDFEDGIQYYSAIQNDLDIIITRDLNDFKASKLPVMTAEEFIKSI